MLAHGLVGPLTRDVDLFTDRDADEAVAVCASLRGVLARLGWVIEAASRPPHENRFVAADGDSGRRVQIEVFGDGGRLRPVVRLDAGPVLHRDDVAADKALALWARGEPRDVIDVAALLEAYDGPVLLELAAVKDLGFSGQRMAEALRSLDRFRALDWQAAGIETGVGEADGRHVHNYAPGLSQALAG